MTNLSNINGTPLVSVIIPSFNRENLISETLDSLIEQTYQNWEALIIDDGSKDNTIVIIRSYCQKDSRFKLFKRDKEPKGAATCRNIGIKQAKGKFLIFLDSDDLLKSDAIEIRVDFLTKNSNLDFAVFQMEFFFKTIGDTPGWFWNKENHKTDLERFIGIDPVWSITGPIWQKKYIQKLGGFNENLTCWQDIDISLKALFDKGNYTLQLDSPPDSYCRRHRFGSISQHHLNSSIKINSRLQLFYWAYYKTLETDTYYEDSIKKALKKMFLGIGFSLGNTFKGMELIKNIIKPEVRKLLTGSEIVALIQNALFYYTRLYKIRKLHSINNKSIHKILSPRTVGKVERIQ